ncbi:hypothetical protein DA792_11110 [Celeribacter baekdonensis]|uniref:Tyr recombinase domain-containing protein n=1 Tax=Celeribacter baekdonensis TaxID=875171 RepID=A0A2R4M8G0_9RHOB|nr:hypothetical protein DA792_11110 [Celeribacter baekdonensis]
MAELLLCQAPGLVGRQWPVLAERQSPGALVGSVLHQISGSELLETRIHPETGELLKRGVRKCTSTGVEYFNLSRAERRVAHTSKRKQVATVQQCKRAFDLMPSATVIERRKRMLPDGLSPHGLRKATCRSLAEAECNAHEIMAISGHQTLAEVTRYTVAANRLHLAERAVAAMERKETRTKTVKPA